MTLGNNEDRISRGLPQSRAAGFAMIRDAVAYPGLKDRSGETRAYLFFFFFFVLFFPLPFRSCMNLRVIYQFPSDDGDALSSSMSSGGCC